MANNKKINETPSEYCRLFGLTGLKPVIEATGESRQTLQNWRRSKPDLFRVVVAGVVAGIN